MRVAIRIILAIAFILPSACPSLTAGDSAPGEPVSALIDVLPAELNKQPPKENWLSYN